MYRPKITIYGANGRIGRSLIAAISQNISNIHLNLVVREDACLRGIKYDIEAVNITGVSLSVQHYDDPVEKSDLIILLAGKTPSDAEKAIFRDIDPSGRMVQALANRNLVKYIGGLLLNNNSMTPCIAVTNQSDMVSAMLRQHGLSAVYGFGNMLDSYRYRAISGALSAQIVGYHNDHMMLLKSSIDFEPDDHMLDLVRDQGRRVSDAYGAPSNAIQQNGAVLGPTLCLTKTVMAFVDQAPPLMESYNYRSEASGFTSLVGMGLPILIKKREFVELDVQKMISDTEHSTLEESHRLMIATFQRLNATILA